MKAKYEHIPRFPDQSIHAFFYNETKFETPWHYHSEMELTYVTQSNGIRYIGNSIENFRAGDLVLLGSSIPHAWKNVKGYEQGSSSIVVQWKLENLMPLIRTLPEFKTLYQLLLQSSKGIFFKSSKRVHLIGNKLMGLPALSGGHKILAFLEILYELSEIEDIQLLSDQDSGIITGHEREQRIQKIFDYIDANYHRKLRIGEVADRVHMTKSAFCKYFKKRFKKTFTVYLNEFRIHQICHELQETNQTINYIAINNGYENMSYFHRQFKLIMGQTPAEYRKVYFEL